MARVSKWGNSLAVRLPAAMVEKMELKEGDEVQLDVTDTRRLEVTVAARRAETLKRLAEFNWTLPADYKFDRIEANER